MNMIKEILICVTIAVVLALIGLTWFYVNIGWPLRAEDARVGREGASSLITQ